MVNTVNTVFFIYTNCILLNCADPEMVDFGSERGVIVLGTGGIARYFEDFKKAKTKLWAKKCQFRSGTGHKAMTTPYRIVIAEDHKILREGLKSLIAANPRMSIVDEAEDGYQALKVAEKVKPDLMLIDLSMPKMNGLDAIREIRQLSPDTKILVLTVHKAEEYVFESLRSGANGYLLKDADASELMRAMENVLSGKTYLSSGISKNVVDGYLKGKTPNGTQTACGNLTRRERQIVKLIAEGQKNREIASLLHISEKTVEKHRSNLMKKLNLHNAAGVTAYALQKGLISKPSII
jgi:DNA-binding NarL/FixJ family response regulator